MKKKNIYRLLLSAGIISAVFLLAACSSRETGSGRGFEDHPLDDFTAYTSNIMTTTPEGYYAVIGEFLYYISPDFKESTIVCSKPDCIHNEKNITNTYEYTECDAYFMSAQNIDYYDEHLYILAWNGSGNDLYQVSIPGDSEPSFRKHSTVIPL